MALHAGEVHYDEHGVTAAAVNLAFRLLDASALKAALTSSPGVLAIIASSWFFEEVVRHSTTSAGYRPVEVAVKETTANGWICLPDHVDPAGQVILQRLSAVGAVPGGQPAVALRTLPRDTAAFTGRTGELDGLVATVCGTATGGGFLPADHDRTQHITHNARLPPHCPGRPRSSQSRPVRHPRWQPSQLPGSHVHPPQGTPRRANRGPHLLSQRTERSICVPARPHVWAASSGA